MEMPEITNPLPDHIELAEKNSFLKKSNLMTFLVVAIVILVIPFSVKLVEQTNILKTRATGNEITFMGDNVSCDSAGVCKALDTKFQVLLKSPLGPPSSSLTPTPSGSQSPTPVPSGSQSPTPSPTLTSTPTSAPIGCDQTFYQDKAHVCYYDWPNHTSGNPTGGVFYSQEDESTSTVTQMVSRDWVKGNIGNSGHSDYVLGAWRKQVYFNAGTYTFYANSDDGVLIRIDGITAEVPLSPVGSYSNHGPGQLYSGTWIFTTAGWYNILVKYYENNGNALLHAWWSTSGGACAQVITSAKDPTTGECKSFPTPCDVPSGWQTVSSCSPGGNMLP